ncbi:unnamed protein product, partial [Prorocentrum cordatum]
MLGGEAGPAGAESAGSATASSGWDEDDASTEGGMDEWGWDPMVDEFLEALVAEAPRRGRGGPAGGGGASAGGAVFAGGGGAAVDWTWVACRFLETLEPDEDFFDQAAAAFERFSPGELQARWDYLQDRRAEAEASATEAEAVAEEPPQGERRL